MIYYAVIDTNVIVSALLKPDSIPGNVVKLIALCFLSKTNNTCLVTENLKHFPKRAFYCIS